MTNTSYGACYLDGHRDAEDEFDIKDFKVNNLAKEVLEGASLQKVVEKAIDAAASSQDTVECLPGLLSRKAWAKEHDENDPKAYDAWRMGWLDQARILLSDEVLETIAELCPEEDGDDDDDEGDDDEGEDDDDEEDDED
jgi:hypothetical protein